MRGVVGVAFGSTFVARAIAVLALAFIAGAPAMSHAQDQLPPLTPTQRDNIQLALNNLNSRITNIAQGLAGPNVTKAQIDRLRHIHANLTDKLAHRSFHAIFELAKAPAKYHLEFPENPKLNDTGTPNGAYCVEGTTILVVDPAGKAEPRQVPCPPGHIVIDQGILDPGNGAPIDQSTQQGWQWKQVLLHVLVHEKTHEILIEEQLVTLRAEVAKNEAFLGAPRTPAERAARLADLARRERALRAAGVTPQKHAEVYQQQIEVLEYEVKILESSGPRLEQRIKELEQTLKQQRAALARLLNESAKLTAALKREKNAARRAEIVRQIDLLAARVLADEAAVGNIEADIAIAERELAALEEKLNFLKAEIGRINDAGSKASGGNQFEPWHRCGFPPGVGTGLLHMYVTAPGSYFRLDGILRNGAIVRASEGETFWLGQRRLSRPISGRPDSIIALPRNVYTGAHVQPASCEFLKSATASGLIRVLNSPANLPALIEKATELPFPRSLQVVSRLGPAPDSDRPVGTPAGPATVRRVGPPSGPAGAPPVSSAPGVPHSSPFGLFAPSLFAGAGNVNAPPTAFFGLREPGTVNERLGVISPNANTSVTTVGGSVRIDFTNTVRLPGLPGGPSLEFAYSHTRGDRSQNFLPLDPQGRVLLAPGTEDPGFALTAGVPPGTAGGFNVVEDMLYRRTFRSDTFGFTVEQPILQAGRVSFAALAGLNFGRTSIGERFSFAIPRFLSDGVYDSNLDFFTFAPAFGGGVYVAVGEIVPGQQTVFYGKAAVGPALTRADGTDRFNMRGFINTNQVADLSGNHTGFFGSFTGGVRVAVGDFFGDGSVTYVTSDSFGNVVRSGQTGETSRVDFVRGDATVFKFTFGAKFGGGVRVPATDFNPPRR